MQSRLRKYFPYVVGLFVAFVVVGLVWNYAFHSTSSTEDILYGNPHLVIWQEELPEAVNLRVIALDEVKTTKTPISYRSGQIELTPLFVEHADGKDVYTFRIFDWDTYEVRDTAKISYHGEKSLLVQRGRHWGISIIRL